MAIKSEYENLLNSDEYKDFLKNEEGFYLVHASMIREYSKKGSWEFGFYNPQRDRIVSFSINPIVRQPEQEAFKEDGIIAQLDIEKVKISYEMAMTICEKLRLEKYSSESVNKVIAILQHLHKQVWNITLVTTAFNLINIKIDAANADIISSSINSILNLGVRQA